jgi:probable HAF family extracellular repeat protein
MDEAVGDARALTGGQHAVLWRGGKDIQLGNFGGGQSRAYDINDFSQVVGWANTAGQPDEAFLWEKGNIYRLEDLIAGGSGFQILGRGFAINDTSQILSNGFGGGASHYLLLNPVPELATPVPLIIGMLGIAGSLVSRRRRLNK